MPPGDTRADALRARVAALRDPEMRVAYVRHELGTLGPSEVAEVVAVAASFAEERVAGGSELLLAVSIALESPSMTALRRAAAHAAALRGQREVVLLLASATPLGEEDEEGSAAPAREAAPIELAGRPLTLGERKSLARKNDRDLITRIIRDPHPDVIKILLGNPALTELDVVRLCARRPIAESVLREVFRSTRWIVRYRVRRTIVLNPYAPLDITLALAPHLTRQDQRLVVEMTDLAEELRRSLVDEPPRPVH